MEHKRTLIKHRESTCHKWPRWKLCQVFKNNHMNIKKRGSIQTTRNCHDEYWSHFILQNKSFPVDLVHVFSQGAHATFRFEIWFQVAATRVTAKNSYFTLPLGSHCEDISLTFISNFRWLWVNYTLTILDVNRKGRVRISVKFRPLKLRYQITYDHRINEVVVCKAAWKCKISAPWAGLSLLAGCLHWNHCSNFKMHIIPVSLPPHT